MSQLGVQLDRPANEADGRPGGPDQRRGSPVKVFVIPTNEQLAIAKDTYEFVVREHPAAGK